MWFNIIFDSINNNIKGYSKIVSASMAILNSISWNLIFKRSTWMFFRSTSIHGK